MCRFVFYQGLPIGLSALLTEPENSLINQSFHSRERKEPLNGDGFGVAWYPEDGDQPALFKSVAPAWNNQNLREIARVVRSPRILGHVRAASPGSRVTEMNSHPFRYGNFTFMHNGELGGFRKFRRMLLHSLSEDSFQMITGSTDSEHIFGVMIDRYLELDEKIENMWRLGMAIERGIETLLEWRRSVVPDQNFYINCLLTDGQDAAACRFTTDPTKKSDSLHIHTGKRYRCVDCRHGLAACEEGHSSVLISSEPLTDDDGWESIPIGGLVMVDENQRLEIRSLEF